MFKTPFKISVVLTAIFLIASGIQQGKIKLSTQFLDDFYKESIRPLIVAEEDTGPKPEDTLEAPFANDETTPRQSTLDLPYNPHSDGYKKLDTPHRPAEEIAAWLEDALAELFSLDPLKYEETRSGMAEMMDGGAIQDFDSFLAKHNVLTILQSNNMVLSGFVEEQPTLLGEKAIDGTYRWVFRVPLTMTMLERDANSYNDINLDEGNRNTRLLVRVQLGRVPEGGIEGIEIERMGFEPNNVDN